MIAFGRTALVGPLRTVVAAIAAALWLVGVNELLLLAAGAVVVTAYIRGMQLVVR